MTPSIERIIALKPQIVLVSTASQLEAFTKQLDQQKIAVYVTDPHSLEEVFRSIATLGDLFGTREQAATLVADCGKRFVGRRKIDGGYTYYDFLQNRHFDIAGPNPTPKELRQFDEQYMLYLDAQRSDDISTALAEKQS